MCELLGISSMKKICVNDLLRAFFAHSVDHPNGWGLAVYHDNIASVEKEPIRAVDSRYLKERLRHEIQADLLIAHIRLATVGQMEYENCHPFIRKDNYGRRWTLAHNGTMFDCPVISKYFYQQEGCTDSERILYYMIDEINHKQDEIGRALTKEERFELLDALICKLAPKNKLNLIIYDGELMYVHTNYAKSLYMSRLEGSLVFATRPLNHHTWELLPYTTLCAYVRGELFKKGTNHHFEYKDNEEDMKYLYLESASL